MASVCVASQVSAHAPLLDFCPGIRHHVAWPLQLSQLIPSTEVADQSSEFLHRTLEVRVASLSREFKLTVDRHEADIFEHASALVSLVCPLVVVRGIVLPLAMDAKGCRLLQVALEEADSGIRKEIVLEFRGNVVKALDSPHANHVLQRVIELVPPRSVHFILDELASSWDMSSIVQHRFGCRLLERILEHFTACSNACSTLDFFMANGAFGDLATHCYHMFGTHVMQHFLEYGTHQHQQMVYSALRSDLQKAALDEFAVGVLDKALTFLPTSDQQQLARDIIAHEGLVPRMAMCWRGQPAAERILRISEGAILTDVVRQIVSHQQALKRSKGGRAVLSIANRKNQ